MTVSPLPKTEKFMPKTNPLRPSIPNPAAPGEFIFLSPLPPEQIRCPACAGYMRVDADGWVCRGCKTKFEERTRC